MGKRYLTLGFHEAGPTEIKGRDGGEKRMIGTKESPITQVLRMKERKGDDRKG